MAKLAVLGQGTSGLVDCSDVVPVPSRAKSQKAVFPAGKTKVDVVGAVSHRLYCISAGQLKVLVFSAPTLHSPLFRLRLVSTILRFTICLSSTLSITGPQTSIAPLCVPSFTQMNHTYTLLQPS